MDRIIDNLYPTSSVIGNSLGALLSESSKTLPYQLKAKHSLPLFFSQRTLNKFIQRANKRKIKVPLNQFRSRSKQLEKQIVTLNKIHIGGNAR